MGFRQAKDERLAWKKWLQRNRSLLVECGLPDEVYEDSHSWDYFLWEATTRTNWFDVGSLDLPQMRRLYNFLEIE